METVVDTNVLVASFCENDALHKRAVKAMDECQKPFIIHEYVALETATVLMNKVDKETADAFLRNTLTNADSTLLHSTVPVFLLAMRDFIGNKTKQLSFVDAALLALSKEYSILTFDDALNRAIKKKAQS